MITVYFNPTQPATLKEVLKWLAKGIPFNVYSTPTRPTPKVQDATDSNNSS